MNKIQAVFIDRDGTIGGSGHFIHPRNFTLFEGAQDSINKIKQAGLKVFAFTNQHRISRNEATIEEFRLQFEQYGFDDSFICPHSEIDNCNCKKPKPGLLFEAAEKYRLDLSECVVIGDVGDTDMLAAHTVGAIKVVVKTGWGESSLMKYRDKWKYIQPDFIAHNINEAVEWIFDSNS